MLHFIIKDMAFFFLIQKHLNLILKNSVCLDGAAWAFFVVVVFGRKENKHTKLILT